MKTQFLVGAALSLLFVPTISFSARANEASSSEENAFLQEGCFRNTFAGVYETKTDLGLNRIGWTLIHNGACIKCEGKTVTPPDSCIEPGDHENETKAIDPQDFFQQL